MALFTNKFDSAKQEWTTPQALFDRLNKEFRFNCDLAADATNTKCEVYVDAERDALTQPWFGTCWLNPPYGAKKPRLQDWVKTAYQETRKPGCVVVMLIPARTNTRWWHDFCMLATEIRFLNGRPRFGDAKHGLPQPLALIVFSSEPGLKVTSYKV